MKTYKAVLNDKKPGVFSISHVLDPAMEGLYIAMSKDNPDNLIELKEVDKERQIVMGLVLEPNKLITRVDKKTGETFNLFFEEETIRELALHFYKNSFQNNSKHEHQEILDGITVLESWFVEDSKIDKSALHGFNFKKGSWIATQKIDNKQYWDEFVKTGKVKGFSVDAFIDLEEIQLNKNDTMKNDVKKAVIEAFEAVFNKKKDPELKSVKSGDTEILFEGEKLESGTKVYTLKDEKQVALAVGQYPLDDNVTLSVEQEGVVKEIKEPVKVKPEGMTQEQAKAIGEAIADAMVTFKAQEDKRFKTIEEENKSMKVELEKLSKAPAADPIQMAAQAAIIANNTPKLDKNGVVLELLRNASNN